jgi:hypothetical protein
MLVLHIIRQRTQQRFAGKVPGRANLTAFQDGAVTVVMVLIPALLMPVQRVDDVGAQRGDLRL